MGIVTMNIDDEFNKLIFNFKVDRHNPTYRKYVQAQEIIRRLYQEISEKYGKVILVSEKMEDINFFFEFSGYKFEYLLIKNPVKPEPDEFKKYTSTDCFLVVSINYRDELIEKLFEQFDIVLDLYDYFEDEGLYFEQSYYQIYPSGYHDFGMTQKTDEYQDFSMSVIYLNHRNRFNNARNEKLKRKYLEEMIFDCTYVKDFISLRKCIDLYLKIDPIAAREYISFMDEVEKLLGLIRNFLHGREQRDIVMYWLDALEYGEDSDMPFLKSLDNQAICFENLYTVTPYTHPVFRLLFAKQRVVEDDSYKIGTVTRADSRLIQDLEERGYTFRCYGAWTRAEEAFCANYCIPANMDFSYVCWCFLKDITADPEKKYFAVLHELYTTHFPYISFGFTGIKYPPTYALPGMQEFDSDKKQRQEQQREARAYIDRQLEFYNGLFPNNTYKLYMSDHGHTFFGRFHVIMKIQQRSLRNVHLYDLMSLYDFDKIILGVLDRNCVDNTELGRDYVMIQDTEYRHHKFILSSINNLDISDTTLIGYQGVITKEDMLIRYREGVVYYTPEYYRKFINDDLMVTDARLNQLRSLVSNKYVDVEMSELFCYSKMVLDGMKRCMFRTKQAEDKKWNIIYNVISNALDNDVVAIRGGGEHTLRLLMCFDEGIRRKIKYVIDRDIDCDASRLGMEVIQIEQIYKYGVDCVVISSFRHRESWKEELDNYKGIKIVDIYVELERQGIVCEKEFWMMDYKKEDFRI